MSTIKRDVLRLLDRIGGTLPTTGEAAELVERLQSWAEHQEETVPYKCGEETNPLNLPSDWIAFPTPAGSVIEHESDIAASMLIPDAWVHDDRSWTVVSPFDAERPVQSVPLANVAGWIVELESEPGVWLTNGTTLGMCLVMGNAGIYSSEATAKGALTKARKHREFADGRVVQVGLVVLP